MLILNPGGEQLHQTGISFFIFAINENSCIHIELLFTGP
jgi:hypothetical protein